MPRVAASRTIRLAAIGTAAGVFSGLFGVGGGTVMVPLLVLWLGYGTRPSTGTSLVAIAVISALAAGVQAAYGNVHPGYAALVGVPAIVGVLLGTWVQQRIAPDTIGLMFAVLMVAVAVDLVLK